MAIARSITRSLAEATNTINAIVHEELETAPETPTSRGDIVRNTGDGFDVLFTPAPLRREKLRDLVTTPERAA
jgi:hypothetical protein